jgi:lipopolysaccharide export system permease protein
MGISYIVKTLEDIDDFGKYEFFQMATLRILEAPEIILKECLLASCMFASVYTMSNLTKNREIMALRSCGVSNYRITSPLIILGLIISLSSLVFEDYVVIRSYYIKKSYKARIKGEELSTYYRDRNNIIVIGEDNVIYKIDRYLARAMEMRGVMVIRKDGSGKILSRVDAAKARWDGKTWVFESAVVHDFDGNGIIQGRALFPELKTDLRDEPKYFAEDTRSIERMTLIEGYNHVRVQKKMGFNYKKDLTKFHRRIAHSITLLLVIIIGLSIGSMPFKNALVVGITVTLMIVLVFFFFIEIGYTFGRSGKIPPALGGWLGNIVFFFISLYLLRVKRV